MAKGPPGKSDIVLCQTDGGRKVKRAARYDSLEAILALGYRVHPPRGTPFHPTHRCNLFTPLIRSKS
jgi:hypothetical protein